MQHIKDILTKTTERASNAKFWQDNKNHFLKYFDEVGNLSASEVYDQHIKNGNFEKMQQIVANSTLFDSLEFLKKVEAGYLNQIAKESFNYKKNNIDLNKK